MITTTLGAIGAWISFILWLPQARATLRVRNDARALSGLSIGTPLLVVCNATVWGVYAFLADAFWVGAPGLINGPLAIWTIWLILRSRRLSDLDDDATAPTACACGYPTADPHDFVVVDRGGYGTVHAPCRGTRAHGIAVPAGAGHDTSARMRGLGGV